MRNRTISSRSANTFKSKGNVDLLDGRIGTSLITFALPGIAANAIQVLNGSVNAAWVSHIIGESALAATTNSFQVFNLLLGAVFGVSIAANILIGQAAGARDLQRVTHVLGTCASFYIIISVLVATLGVLLTRQILNAMGTPENAMSDAIAYLRTIFLALPSVYLINFVMGTQRALGNSKIPFYFSLMQICLDVILNPLLIIGLGPFSGMGVVGSAAAMFFSQTITLVVMYMYLYKTSSISILRAKDWRVLKPDWPVINFIIVKGLPISFQMMMTGLAGLFVMKFANSYGIHTAAAYGAVLQLWNYIQIPTLVMSGAITIMAAQNLGAYRMDRVERIAWVGAAYSLGIAIVISLAIILMQHWILMSFLRASSSALPIAERINVIGIWAFIPFGASFSFASVVRANGAVWPPLAATFVGLWFVRVPFAFLMQPYWGADAVWASFVVDNLVTLSLTFAYYRWGDWRKLRLTREKYSAVDVRSDAV